MDCIAHRTSGLEAALGCGVGQAAGVGAERPDGHSYVGMWERGNENPLSFVDPRVSAFAPEMHDGLRDERYLVGFGFGMLLAVQVAARCVSLGLDVAQVLQVTKNTGEALAEV